MPDRASTMVEEVQQSEPSVLDRFQQGDMAAFEAVFREHQRSVYGWILCIVRDAGAAEELTVESFWRIYRAHARFDSKRGFSPWARRFATRAALDWLRTRKPEVELKSDIAAPAFADAAANAEIRAAVARAFGRLPAGLRAAAALAVVEDQPHKDVAAALGISVAAVKVRVFRALRRLRADLERQGITP